MIRKLILIPAAATTLFAVAQLYFTLSNSAMDWWAIVRMFAAIAVLVMGWLTLKYANSEETTDTQIEILQTGAIGLVLLGVVGSIMAFQTGQATGDFEYYLFLADALFIGQGVLTLGALWLEGRLLSTH
jgi:Ca2+/Na+ antiporter